MTYETGGLAHGLEQLVTVVEEQHIGRAAERLGIPQPTLSRSLVRLSETLGVPLVERDGRGIRVTRHAQTLAGYAGRALQELLGGIRHVRDDCDPEAGAVAVGFLPSLTAEFMPQLVARLLEQWPHLRIEIVQDHTDNLLAGVRTGALDACLAAPVGPPPSDLVSHSFHEQRLVAVLSAHHPLAGSARISARRLLSQPLITMKPGYGLRTFTDSLFNTQAQEPHYAFESWDIASAVGLASTGLGIAVLPEGSSGPDTVELAIAGIDARRDIRAFWADAPCSIPAQRLRQSLTRSHRPCPGREPQSDRRHAH
jgi:LysR family transcriptional regulator, transcription activator of glutamate synthase operon